MPKCPTCGRGSDDLPDFSVGDRVKHMNGYAGVVTEIGQYRGSDCVIVAFDEDFRGAYDAWWFKTHPHGLAKLRQST